jgi:hypothetical protein
MFLHHVHHGMNLQEAIDCPAFHNEHMPSSFYPRAAHPGLVALEARFPEATRTELARRGHRVRVGEAWSEGRLSGCARETKPEGTVLKAPSSWPRVGLGRSRVSRVNGRDDDASQGRAPRVLITDKLKSYAAAKREIMPGVEHRQHKGLNNRAENSHQPTRRRERIMKRFKSPRQVQRFPSAHDQVANIFPRRRDHDTAANLRSSRTQAFVTWADVTGVAMAA